MSACKYDTTYITNLRSVKLSPEKSQSIHTIWPFFFSSSVTILFKYNLLFLFVRQMCDWKSPNTNYWNNPFPSEKKLTKYPASIPYYILSKWLILISMATFLYCTPHFYFLVNVYYLVCVYIYIYIAHQLYMVARIISAKQS